MRKALFLMSAVALTLAAALAPRPAQALPQNCGCYCLSYPTLQCKLNGTWISCRTYASVYC